jgi:hypothetical protein
MVDRVYKASLPEFRIRLEKLREEFAALYPSSDWTSLRIEPLFRHLDSLERIAGSRAHAASFARLTKGVAMFHADLVYFRVNLEGLERILESERRRAENRRPSATRVPRRSR